MRACLFLFFLFLAACKGPGDLAPDEFRLDYTRGWADNNFDHRNVDFATDSDAVTIGFSWYLGETAADREAKRQADQIERLTNLIAEERMAKSDAPAPPPVVVTVPTPAPEPRHDAEPRPRSTPEPGTCGPTGTTTKPEPAKTHDPDQRVTLTGFGGNAMEYLLYTLGALVLAVVGVLKRRYLAEKAETIRSVAVRPFSRKKAHGKAKDPPKHDAK